jgi:hypothetical protein
MNEFSSTHNGSRRDKATGNKEECFLQAIVNTVFCVIDGIMSRLHKLLRFSANFKAHRCLLGPR